MTLNDTNKYVYVTQSLELVCWMERAVQSAGLWDIAETCPCPGLPAAAGVGWLPGPPGGAAVGNPAVAVLPQPSLLGWPLFYKTYKKKRHLSTNPFAHKHG